MDRLKMHMKPLGLLLIAIAILTPLLWFIPIAMQRDAIAVGSQYLGAVALIVMAIAQVIATRLPGVEALFGSLDRSYVLHKWLGVGALAAIILHDTIDAEIDGLGRETALVELGETLGEISLYALIALIVLSVATFTPYTLWKWTHKFMGAAFTFGAIHFILIRKPFAMADAPGLYTGVFCAVGVLAYLYTLLPHRIRPKRRGYRVESATDTGDSLAVSLAPINRSIKHAPGQFAFVSFDHPRLSEPHPFTISAAPEAEGRLRFTIKPLGDHTGRLRGALEPGTRASVEGPFGGFGRPAAGEPDIWIAAGVGITPFLSWARAMKPEDRPAHLFYSVRRRADAAHLAELEQAAEAKPLTLHLIETATDGRLTAARVAETVGGDLSNARVSFCGPEPMRDALRKDFAARGLAPSRFQFEFFELRSGVGFRKLLRWVGARLPR